MELVGSNVKERWEKANEQMSKHCFEAGRLKYAIELGEEDLERQKLSLRNMRVDFDKLNKELQAATKAYFAKEKSEQIPESLPQ